jgi:hypothetical protein
MADTESIDRRHFNCNFIIGPLAKFSHSYVDIFLSPVALTAVLCSLFGSSERNPFSICPELNGRNFCFLSELP